MDTTDTIDIIVVGDIHGDWGPLNKLIQKKEPKIILQCGDFGWWPKMEVEKPVIYRMQSTWKLKGIKPGVTTVYWADGNHEDHHDLIKMGSATESEIICYPQVIYKPRGTTLELPDGRIVLFAGGGDSIDKGRRTEGTDWFPEEIPNQREHIKMLEHPHIDIVISHTCPSAWIPDVCKGEKFNDPTRELLQDVLEKYKPSLWYHGHWHHEASGVSGKSDGVSGKSDGVSGDTRWFSLDCPKHGGRWWINLD